MSEKQWIEITIKVDGIAKTVSYGKETFIKKSKWEMGGIIKDTIFDIIDPKEE